jgi:hypothetical protein
MALEDLEDKWADYDRKLDASLRLNARLLRESGLGRTRSMLTRLLVRVVGDLVVNLVLLIALGLFVANHFDQPRFLVPGLVLHLGAILLVIGCARQLALLKSIDYGAAVIAIQKRLQQLRILRIRTSKWLLLCVPLLWTPMLIVALKGYLGVDAYASFSGRWLAANLIAGVAVIPLMIWVSRRFAGRLQSSAFYRRLLDDIAGRNLAAATGYLDALASFEADQEQR